MAGSLGWLLRYSDQNSVCKPNRKHKVSLLTIESIAYFFGFPLTAFKTMYVPVLSLGVFCCCCCFERTYLTWGHPNCFISIDAQEVLPPRCGLIALISSLWQSIDRSRLENFIRNILLEMCTFGLPLGMFLKIKFTKIWPCLRWFSDLPSA